MAGIHSIVKSSSKVALLVDDLTRTTPCNRILPILLNELNSAGVSDDSMKIFIALGTHRLMSSAEMRSRFGEEAMERVEIENHDYKDESKLEYMGTTENGTPVWINAEVCNFPVKIGVGPRILASRAWRG